MLARPDLWEEVAGSVLEETSTIGLRLRRELRLELERSSRKVRTKYGTVAVKIAARGDRVFQAWPEFEDCAALARRHGVPLTEVQEAALHRLRSAGNVRSKRSRE